jgi:hypothetical protein
MNFFLHLLKYDVRKELAKWLAALFLYKNFIDVDNHYLL